MSCCGQKRNQLMQELYPENHPAEKSTGEKIQIEKGKAEIFEYTGEGSIRIRGAVTRNSYYFRFSGHKLEVPPEDVSAFMAEQNLQRVSIR